MLQLKFMDDGTLTEDSLHSLQEAADSLVQGKSTMEQVLGLSAEQFEALYAVGYTSYMAGKYEDAAKMFTVLIAIRPYDVRIFMGIAAALQMLRKYRAAAFYYQWACGLDQQDPVLMLHSAECFLGMNDQASAISALRIAVERAGNEARYEAVRNRAKVMLHNLEKAQEAV